MFSVFLYMSAGTLYTSDHMSGMSTLGAPCFWSGAIRLGFSAYHLPALFPCHRYTNYTQGLCNFFDWPVFFKIKTHIRIIIVLSWYIVVFSPVYYYVLEYPGPVFDFPVVRPELGWTQEFPLWLVLSLDLLFSAPFCWMWVTFGNKVFSGLLN